MKIAVLCGYLDSFAPVGKHTIDQNKRRYCLRHGYDINVLRGINPRFVDSHSHAGGFTWSRLLALLEMIESGKWDWVWTVGADTLIMNFRTRLEDIIDPALTPEAESRPLPKNEQFAHSLAPPPVIHWQKPANHPMCGKKHLLICGERVAPIQADSFIVRCSPEGVGYVRDILAQYEHYKHHPWVENQAMIDLREKHAALTYIVPQHLLNAYDYSRWYGISDIYRAGTDCYGNRGQWLPGDFLIHWPASGLTERLEFLKTYQPLIVY